MGNRALLLEIYLFGVPRLVLDGHALDGIRRKNRALIFYLAAEKQRVLAKTCWHFSGLTMNAPPHNRSCGR